MPRYKKSSSSKTNPERKVSPEEQVLICLKKTSSPVQRGVIEIFLKQEYGIEYYDHKGMDHILKKLMIKGLIKKNPKMHGRPYPTYELTLEGSKDIRIKANIFSNSGNKILGIQNFPLMLSDMEKLEELVKIVGVYTIFTHLKGKQLSLTKSKITEQWQIENSWLGNTLPMNNVSFFIKQCFFTFLKDDKSKKQKIFKLEKELKKGFPEEYLQLEEIYSNLDESVSQIRNKKRKWDELNAWKIKLSKQNKKNIKLKPNQCPLCRYDGTKKVEIGPCKGQIFQDGYYPQKRPKLKKEIRVIEGRKFEVKVHELDKKGRPQWYLQKECPACGYLEGDPLKFDN